MSRTVKFMVFAAVLEMALVAAGVIAWRALAMGGLEPFQVRRAIILALVPAAVLFAARIFARRLASDSPKLSPSHRGFMESGLGSLAVIAAAAHGFMAYRFLVETPLNREGLVRAAVAFVGVYVAVRGNFAAKLDPPTGEGAPPSGVWTRSLLGLGWLLMLLGLAVVACALVLPLRPLLAALMVVAVAMIAAELVLRRRFRQGQGAR